MKEHEESKYILEKISDQIVGLSNIDLNKLSIKIDVEIRKREERSRLEAMATIKRIAVEAGLSVSVDVIATNDITKSSLMSGMKAKVKYRHNATGNEWSGRGLKPRWVKDIEEKGIDINDYLTDEFK